MILSLTLLVQHVSSRVKKKRFKKSSDEYFRDNILNRDFSTTKDNQKWSTDITEINTGEGKLYVSGVIDINSKMLISYEIGNHNNNELVMKTFKNININDVDIL
ncbi:DDE-type integrase/transposase/recombinase, partial [Pseudostreptobacillus sp.]